MAKRFKFKSEKKSEKWHVFNLNPCGEARIKAPRTELLGNREMTLDGCEGVLEYRDDFIKLKLARGSITVLGSGFEISAFDGAVITVKGNFSSVEFCV